MGRYKKMRINEERNRVVITSVGAVSPFGFGVEKMMEGLYSGKSSVKNMKAVWEEEINDLNSWVGAPLVEQLDVKLIHRKLRKTMGRVSILAVSAVKEAVEFSNLPVSIIESGRVGVCFGSSTGSISSIQGNIWKNYSQKSLHEMPAGTFFQIMSHTCAANIARYFNIRGRVISSDCACSSAAQAIGIGYETIKNGIQDIMLCGGADELHPITNAIFDSLNAASWKFNDTPNLTPRPFDRERDGTVCSDGAGCVILESLDSALSRGADILGEIIGFSTLSSGRSIANSDLDSIVFCIKNGLADAGVDPSVIGYINAHATGTIVGDSSEAGAIRQVFGGSVPVSSLKGHLGHTLGASAALEVIASLRMMKDGKIIPTKNLDCPPEDCSGINHIVKQEDIGFNMFVKNSFGFGGINSVLIIKELLFDE